MSKMLHVGDVVIFHDDRGRQHNALITAVWSQQCVNLVHVSSDENRQDDYGRQIERPTSVEHVSRKAVHGMYFRLPDEPVNEYVEPEEV